MVCFGSQCLSFHGIFPISFDVHVFMSMLMLMLMVMSMLYVEASGLSLFIIDGFLILILASSQHSTPHVTRSWHCVLPGSRDIFISSYRRGADGGEQEAVMEVDRGLVLARLLCFPLLFLFWGHGGYLVFFAYSYTFGVSLSIYLVLMILLLIVTIVGPLSGWSMVSSMKATACTVTLGSRPRSWM